MIRYGMSLIDPNIDTVVGETMTVQTLAGFWIFLEIFKKQKLVNRHEKRG